MEQMELLKAAATCLAKSIHEAEEVRLGMAKADTALRGIGSKLPALRSEMVPLQVRTRAHRDLSRHTEVATDLTWALHHGFLRLRDRVREIRKIPFSDDDRSRHYVEAVRQVGEGIKFVVSTLHRLQDEDVGHDLKAAGRRRLLRIKQAALHLTRISRHTLDAQFRLLLGQEQASISDKNARRRLKKLKVLVEALGPPERCRDAFVHERSRHCCSLIGRKSSSNWITDLEDAVGCIYMHEKRLCEHLFNGDLDGGELVAMVAQPGMSQLVTQGKMMVTATTEELEELLDMFQALCKVTPIMSQVFDGDGPNCSRLRAQVRELHKLTVVASCTSFQHLDHRLFRQNHQSRAPPRDAGVMQTLTSHALDYLERLVQRQGRSLEQVLAIEHGWSTTGSSSSSSSSSSSASSPSPCNIKTRVMGHEVKRLLACLGRAIVEQSHGYDEGDTVRRRIFVMNNRWYIVKRVSSSCEFGTLVGDVWIQKERSLLKQQALEYHKEAWGAILGLVATATRLDGGRLLLVSSLERELIVRQRIDALSLALDHACQAHEQVVLSDPDLCHATRASLARNIVPAYRTYLQSFARLLGPGFTALPPQRIEHLLLHHLFANPSSCDCQASSEEIVQIHVNSSD